MDGSLSINQDFDPYDMPVEIFDFPADAWLHIRSGMVQPEYFYNAGGYYGDIAVIWSLFYDFHSLMNNEIIYLHHPIYGDMSILDTLSHQNLEKIDNLARLMQYPDENFDKLVDIWNFEKDFRLLFGGLI